MSVSPLPPRESRLATAVAVARDGLARVAEVPAWQLSDRELLDGAEDMYRLVSIVQAQALRMLAEIDTRGLAPDAGSPTTSAWLTARVQMPVGAARRQVALAHTLTAHPATAAALSEGVVNLDHAVVITDALDALPATIQAPVVAEAEQTLLEHAHTFTPRTVRRIGHHLTTVLDPDGPEPADSEPADPGYYLHLWTRADGACEGQFLLDPVTALTLTELIDAGSAPRPSSIDGPDSRTAGRRRADALVDLLARAAGNDEPAPGRARPTIAVSITLDELRRDLPVLGPDDQTLTPAMIRRLSCDAGIIPIVLGSRGEVLDIGRRTRTIPVPIRRALIERDDGCAFPHCGRPPSWTDAHHITPWSQGGRTALNNLVLLCGHHHDTVHHRGWTVRIDQGTGLPTFTPPPWLR